MTKVEIVNNTNKTLVRFDSLPDGTLVYSDHVLLLKVPKVSDRSINVMYFGGDDHGDFGLMYDGDLVTVVNEIKVEVIS